MEISQETREKLLRMAYDKGFQRFKNSQIVVDNKDSSMICHETHGNNSISQVFAEIEDHFGFERDKHDWDNFGIYGIIEDSSVCYEAGARDGMDNNDHNPERIRHMWD